MSLDTLEKAAEDYFRSIVDYFGDWNWYESANTRSSPSWKSDPSGNASLLHPPENPKGA